MWRIKLLSFCFSLCLFLSLLKCSTQDEDQSESQTHAAERIPGHRRPLGAHTRHYGVTAIGKFSLPQTFYGNFVKANKPLQMRSALTEAKHPGMEWTDEYLRNHHGTELVRVELGKNEVRNRTAQKMRLKDFLDDYSQSDLYMVHSIQDSMEDLVYIPSTLQCGGFEKNVLEAVMWMGKGPLRSVLHYDELDNLLCVFDGVKDVVLIDKFFKDTVEQHGFVEKGHYSLVDPESVDMHTFPQFQGLPWHKVHLDPGDCVYIPYGWYHQVTTYGERSLAMNTWFSHLWWFDDATCKHIMSFPPIMPLDQFGGFSSPNQALRSQWLEKFEGTDDDVDMKEFSRRVSSGTEEHLEKVFSLIDFDGDGLLTWEELSSFEISKALLQCPSVFKPSSIPTDNIQNTVEPDELSTSEHLNSESSTVTPDSEKNENHKSNQRTSKSLNHEEL